MTDSWIVTLASIVFGIVVGLVATLWRHSERRAEERSDRLERHLHERFDSLDEEMKRARQRLHQIENWVASQISLEKVRAELRRQRGEGEQ